MNTESFVVYIKTEGSYVNILKDIETLFDTSKCESDRPLSERKISSWLIKDDLDTKVMPAIAALETKNV